MYTRLSGLSFCFVRTRSDANKWYWMQPSQYLTGFFDGIGGRFVLAGVFSRSLIEFLIRSIAYLILSSSLLKQDLSSLKPLYPRLCTNISAHLIRGKLTTAVFATGLIRSLAQSCNLYSQCEHSLRKAGAIFVDTLNLLGIVKCLHFFFEPVDVF